MLSVFCSSFLLLQYLLSVAIAVSCSQQSHISKICELQTVKAYHIDPTVLDNIYMKVPTCIPPSPNCQTCQSLLGLDFLFIQCIYRLHHAVSDEEKETEIKNFLNDSWSQPVVDSSAKILIQCFSNILPVEVEECQASQGGCVCRLDFCFFTFSILALFKNSTFILLL